jgi:hypothetical protein
MMTSLESIRKTHKFAKRRTSANVSNDKGGLLMKVSEPGWLQHIRDIEKHLEKNEKWLKQPESKFNQFNKEAEAWEKGYLAKISDVEKFAKELEKTMEKL